MPEFFMKECKTCKHEKKASQDMTDSEFGRHAHTKDGFQSSCRECNSDRMKKSWRTGNRGQGKPKRRKSKPVIEKKMVVENRPWTCKDQMVYCNGQPIALATDERRAREIINTRNEFIKSRMAMAIFEQLKQFVSKEIIAENAQLGDEVSKLKALASKKKEIPIIDGNGGGVHKRKIRASKLRYIKSNELRRLMKRDEVTAKGLSKVLSIHQDCIYNWLNHKTQCKMGNIQSIAEYFEVDVSTLIDRNA